MLAGGADILTPFPYEVITKFWGISPGRSGGEEGARPFDKKRNGPVAGEGAGIICLESLEHAESRGVSPYCEIKGFGMSSYPSPLNDWPNDPGGAILAITRAMKSQNLRPEDIDYISASANGGEKLDKMEAKAISQVFGEGSEGPLVGSIKGAVGESYSSGGIRATALALTIKNGIIPPTLGLTYPISPLNFVMGEKVETNVKSAMINGFSSGGTFVSLVFGDVD